MDEYVKEYIEDAVRDFKDHVAIRTFSDEFEVIDWRRPGTSSYAMRMVFDKMAHSLYITGDLGSAIVCPTCHCSLKAVAECFTRRNSDGSIGLSLSYFDEKISSSSDRYHYDTDSAIKSVEERVEEYRQNHDNLVEATDEIDDDDIIEDLSDDDDFEDIDLEDLTSVLSENIDSVKGITVTESMRDAFEKLDTDWWEWAYELGKQYDVRMILWLVAIRLASERLEANEGDTGKTTEKPAGAVS